MHLRKCKIVSGMQLQSFLLISRAHPDVYKPLDVLDDDELDGESTEAPETATEKGDEKLNQRDSESKNQKQGNSDESQMEKEKKKSDKQKGKKSNESKEKK